jgi:hypothetical protein
MWVDSEVTRYFEKLKDINASLGALILGDKGLGSSELLS